MDAQPLFFSVPGDFRQWLDENHASVDSLWVGFYKVSTGLSSITWPESVDEALCYGWIDGIRKKVDEESYKIRFTPRRKGSHWSDVNIKKVAELKKKGLMKPAGLLEFEKRTEMNSRRGSFEQDEVKLPLHFEELFKKNKKAWKYFQKMPPGYHKQAIWYVIQAKQEETKLRRLNNLIACSELGEKIPQLKSGGR